MDLYKINLPALTINDSTDIRMNCINNGLIDNLIENLKNAVRRLNHIDIDINKKLKDSSNSAQKSFNISIYLITVLKLFTLLQSVKVFPTKKNAN